MKRLITVLMIMILLAGCSGKKNEMKPAAPVPGVPSAKPADSDPYEKFYGTWRTSALEINGTRFNMEQLETLGYKEQCDLIFVLAKDGVGHRYVFYGDTHQEFTWSKTDDKNVIDVNGVEFVYTDNEISFIVSDTTNAILSKVSDRQDKDIIDELIAEVCTFYDDLTLDDIYDGLEAKELDDFVWDTCDYIVDGTVGRLEALREKQISASGEEVRQGATANK